MHRLIPRAQDDLDALDALAAEGGWREGPVNDHPEIALREAVWHAPDGTRIALVDDGFLRLVYLALEGPDAAPLAALIGARIPHWQPDELSLLYVQTPDPAARGDILLALSLIAAPGDAAATRAILSAFEDGDAGLRAAAATAVAQMDDPTLRRDAARYLPGETDPEVRARLREALG